jgi:Eukaryotic membrane protein family
VLECLFSKEALERHPDGRSKVMRPLWLFFLALVYNIAHAIALFYQVITLNVAVNSYSNALLTLLMSNQFVEIKSTVFKRFEKENIFQMTCADIVERFQLWLMLMIIASRNVIETNSLFGDTGSDAGGGSAPLRTSSLLPSSFTLMPSWAGQVMGPFFLVLGIEMLVDWVKHAYITKFNNTRPSIYGRFLDVLAKDYYSYAFAEQNLTKRLGLPVIPLSCLFIRAAVQTYQMFLSTHLPLPLVSPATSLEASDPSHSPATTAEMLQLPHLLRRALGRHVPADTPSTTILHIPYLPIPLPSADTLIAWISTGVLAALCFAVLLAVKLALGMALLAFARKRYVSMKSREHDSGTAEGRRIGGWGTVEVGEDKRRWIYEEDPEGLKKLWEREQRERERDAKGRGFGGVERYSMVAKRIW